MITSTDTQPTAHDTRTLERWFRAANYLGAAQLYLRDNALLERPLAPADIKPRLLGHWGTQPGLNFVYAHLNRLINDTKQNTLLICGPGHGAPAIIANLFLEGSLEKVDARYAHTQAGVGALVHDFSWPGGFASHLTPHLPGMMHEGGELGYALIHAQGVALDNPDLLVACIIGDGEAESGALSAAWKAQAFLNPATCGGVLPILHLNGYKLSGPSLYARLPEADLDRLFRGLGYEPLFVDTTGAKDVHAQMASALDVAHASLREIQNQARRGVTIDATATPMIVLRTPKGWTGPKSFEGIAIEGTFHSHQIPLMHPAKSMHELEALETWLRSYRPEELFEHDGSPADDIRAFAPPPELRMGANPHANGGLLLRDLVLPEMEQHAVALSQPGALVVETVQKLGGYLRDVFALNAETKNFRLMCPDETSSNHLQDVYGATQRAWMLPLVETDQWLAPDGRVMEILSEHCCQGWLEAYLLSGRHGIFACYEAFVQIASSMASLYLKWLKMASEVPWREPVAALNYVLTSHVWRQDQDGYSHQGPGFINTLLQKKRELTRIYLACDANILLAVTETALRSRNRVNLIICGKHEAPQWLTYAEAKEHVARGASEWTWAGQGNAAQVVLASAGDVPTLEAMAAAQMLRERLPDFMLTFVNIVNLFALDRTSPDGLNDADFNALFPHDLPVVFAFHGYPGAVHEVLHGRPAGDRFHVHGYLEEGTTTTPFDMTVRNRLSRFHLVIDAVERSGRNDAAATALITECRDRLAAHHAYIAEHGQDMPEIREWRWSA